MNTRTKHYDPYTLSLFSHPESHEGDGRSNSTNTSALPDFDDIKLRAPVPDIHIDAITVPVPVFSLRLVRERDHLTEKITTPAEAARLCCELLEGYDREVFLVVALSTASRVIGVHAAHTGTVNASVASPREALKFCLLVNARSFLIAHNHPSGNLEPSREDVAVSKQMQAAGATLSIPLADSLVTGFGGQFTSLAERGLL